MTRKSTIVLAIFILMVTVNAAVSAVLSGGSDTKIIGGSFEHLREARGFIGTVSVTLPDDSAFSENGQLAVLSAGGRFFVPEGKALVGAWNVSDGNVLATNSLVDTIATGDGYVYLRDNGLSDLPLGKAFGLTRGKWLQMSAADLWPPEGVDERPDGADLWNRIFDLATDPTSYGLLGRAISEDVVGVPSWHFLLRVDESAAYDMGLLFAELRRGRPLESFEKERIFMLAQAAQPRVDLWVSKETGRVRQVALTYLLPMGEAIDEDDMEAVVVTFNVSEYPEWAEIDPPENYSVAEPAPPADQE